MYRILCDRMPARELGSGLTWYMIDGRVIEFATTEEAGAKVKELTERRNATKTLSTSTVTYTAKEVKVY
jgi:hypothetical protein